jgi:hypothetical protein
MLTGSEMLARLSNGWLWNRMVGVDLMLLPQFHNLNLTGAVGVLCLVSRIWLLNLGIFGPLLSLPNGILLFTS